MNILQDVITYVRRLVKTPSNAVITDALIIDYINRFWLLDMDARFQLFDLKTKYGFQTSPGIADYNMPLYNIQTETGNQQINFLPVYQGFMQSCYANGIQVPFYTQRESFWNLWPNYLQFLNPAGIGNGGSTYTLNLPFFPAIPGHVDITGIIATGTNQDPIVSTTLPQSGGGYLIPSTSFYPAVFIIAQDSSGQTRVMQDTGIFLMGAQEYGLLMAPGTAPFGYSQAFSGYSTGTNTVNYQTGVVNVTFTDARTGLQVDIPPGNPIQTQCYFYQQGLPRAILYYNNVITIRPPPDISYYIELDAYLTPAAFLNSGQAVQFAYMSEYIARGAARKLLSDTGDIEQFQFYEPLFREQEMLVWKRSQRQFTSTRTGTIFSDLQGQSNYNNIGQGST